jgi:DNA-directed RNA polymerase sigma subunit (sigma70/sigma32)
MKLRLVGKKLWPIAQQFDVTPEHIRKIEARALRKLRKSGLLPPQREDSSN